MEKINELASELKNIDKKAEPFLFQLVSNGLLLNCIANKRDTVEAMELFNEVTGKAPKELPDIDAATVENI